MKIDVAKKNIEEFLDKHEAKAFLRKNVGQILEEQRGNWKLPESISVASFIKYLQEK